MTRYFVTGRLPDGTEEAVTVDADSDEIALMRARELRNLSGAEIADVETLDPVASEPESDTPPVEPTDTSPVEPTDTPPVEPGA